MAKAVDKFNIWPPPWKAELDINKTSGYLIFWTPPYFDEEFKEATTKLFERLDNNEIIFVVSDLLDLELINAPQQVREHLLKYSADKFQRIELTEEAIKLADTYINEKIVGKTSLEDCRHIALATIHKVDV